MKKDEELQKDVMEAIKWEPLLHAAEIGVIAQNGIITLTGTVENYAKKLEAEHAAKNVKGVTAVVEKITIKSMFSDQKSDTEIAIAALKALKWSLHSESNKIKVKVEDGWISLEGQLTWNYQKETAKRSVASISSVKGVFNYITIDSELKDQIEKEDIEKALTRNWSIDDSAIEVSVVGNNVQLKGKVLSLYQKEEAGKMAWNAPGVSTVENLLEVERQ
jgi:osmotically-inducible protein OsmY